MTSKYEDNRLLVGIISDKETTLGFLLAGIGQCQREEKNYMITDDETPTEDIEEFFVDLYHQSNICAILISHDNAERLSHEISKCNKQVPVLVTIPTKGTIMQYTLDREKMKRHMIRDDAYI